MYLNRLTPHTNRLPLSLSLSPPLSLFCSLELALHSTGILGCARDKVTENVSRRWRWCGRRRRRRSRRSRHCCRRCCKCLKVNFEFKIHHVTQYVDLLNTNAKSSDSTNASLYSKWVGGKESGGGWMWNVEANAKWQHKLKYTHTPLPAATHTFPHPQQILVQQTQREFWRQTDALLANEYLRLFCWAYELKLGTYIVYIYTE